MKRGASVAAAVLFATLAAARGEPPPAPAEQTEVPYRSQTRGALRVKGDTRDWFRITKGGKDAGPPAPPLLNSAAELEPGEYEVTVNKTRRTVTVRAGREVVLQTGTLVVEGTGADWYAPYEGKQQRVADAPPTLNKPIALFPGTYAVLVRVGDRDVKLTDAARVVAGRKTVLTK
jgi:hypothetical protein